MIKKIFNCISIHSGGGITYLSMMHNDLDKRSNLIFFWIIERENLSKNFAMQKSNILKKIYFEIYLYLKKD